MIRLPHFWNSMIRYITSHAQRSLVHHPSNQTWSGHQPLSTVRCGPPALWHYMVKSTNFLALYGQFTMPLAQWGQITSRPAQTGQVIIPLWKYIHFTHPVTDRSGIQPSNTLRRSHHLSGTGLSGHHFLAMCVKVTISLLLRFSWAKSRVGQ